MLKRLPAMVAIVAAMPVVVWAAAPSQVPAAGELRTWRVFGEPLVSIGEPAPAQETAALAEALRRYGQAGDSEATGALEQFLERHPRSSWAPSLLFNLGSVWRDSGRYSQALDAWSRAWVGAREATDPEGTLVANVALANLIELTAALGRVAQLESLLHEADGRSMTGAAAEQVSGGRRALGLMRAEPGVAFRCGPLALERVSRRLHPDAPVDRAVLEYPSTSQGTHLAEVEDLARRAGLDLRAAWRRSGSHVPVPSVVHWKLGHFAAVTEEERGRFLVQDLTFGRDVWVSRAALDRESSGYLLASARDLDHAGWRRVGAPEARSVRGKGVTGNPDPGATTPHDPQQPSCNPPGAPRGMPVPGFHTAIVSLSLRDVPLTYTVPRGPSVEFELRYGSREASQPATFTFSNVGPRWTHNWLSYVKDNPTLPGQTVTVAERSGGYFTYSGYSAPTASYSRNVRGRHDVLVRTTSASYERRYPDGSIERYTASDGGSTTRRIFLTSIVDPDGNTVSLVYDASLRLTQVRDSVGQATTFTYGLAADPLRITRVTDPFGRYVSIAYDAAGRIASLTDPIGLTSSFSYGPTATSPTAPADFVNAMTTPYGTTSFDMGEAAGGPGWSIRWLEATDPAGGRQRVEFRHDAPGIAPTSADPVPPGFTNNFLQYRNTFYWDARAMGVYDAADPERYKKATYIFHWLHDGTGASALASSILESVQRYGERRIWMAYPGQPDTITQGTLSKPARTSRMLDDGTEQKWTTTYSSGGWPTRVVDPVGRDTRVVYNAAGTAATEIRNALSNGSGERLVAVEYNAQLRPVRVTDYSGAVFTATYNGFGQLTSITLPGGGAYILGYDAQGYLTSLGLPAPGMQATFTYDSAKRVRTASWPGEPPVTYDYDALDRVTGESYPDGTSTAYTYDRLDLVETRDRSGRVSRTLYNPLRQRIEETDAAGRTTVFDWCNCGTLHALVDPAGNRTEWVHDELSRVVAKIEGGVTTASYNYDGAGRRIRRTDAKGQVAAYTYTRDSALAAIDYLNAEHATPPVRFLWDTWFRRVLSMSDGQGTTSFRYNVGGVPGAGQVVTILGPKAGQTITFQHDALGRLVGQTVDGVTQTRAFDLLDRQTQSVSPLGTSTLTYDSATAAPLQLTYPNGARAEWTWADAAGGHVLQRLRNVGPVGQVYSDSTYAYASGNEQLSGITTGASPTWRISSFSYDLLGQLLSASSATASEGPLAAGPTSDALSPELITYGYDLAGNRTSEEIDGSTSTAAYNDRNQLVSLRRGLSQAAAAALLDAARRELEEHTQRQGRVEEGGIQ